jgi:septin family protein
MYDGLYNLQGRIEFLHLHSVVVYALLEDVCHLENIIKYLLIQFISILRIEKKKKKKKKKEEKRNACLLIFEYVSHAL